MSDAVLTVLKFCLLALLYVFLVRVVWIVARELRGTAAPKPAAIPVPAAAAPAPAAARARNTWRLVIVKPDAERGRAFPVDGESTLGRGGGCTVALTYDTFASTVHARTYERDGALWLEDVGSTNGTLVNSARIDKPTRLRKGDRIQLGETVLEVDR